MKDLASSGTKEISVAQSVLRAMESVLKRKANLHEPCFEGNETKYVTECIDTKWVSSAGKFVDRFEEDLCRYTGAAAVVAVVNGTAALHVALKAVGAGEGDEVLIPNLTFVATANAVAYTGATPHLVDSDEKTLGVDPAKLEAYLERTVETKNGVSFNKATGKRLRALVVVHAFGHPSDLDALDAVCRRFHIEFIEDAAESLGSFYKGRHTGNSGRFGTLSFNGNKIVTTGGGGAVLCRDAADAKRIKHWTTTAKAPHPWNFYHDELGYNYRMPNLNAALGCAQLEQLGGFLEKKRALAARYREAFSGMAGLRFFDEPLFAKSNYWLNVILLDRDAADRRDEVLSLTNQNGYMTRPAWTLMHELPMYAGCPRMDISTAQSLEARLINLPSSTFL